VQARQRPAAVDPASRSRSLPYSVAVNGAELRHQMRIRGLTAAELARRARARRAKVSEATISHALNGRRIHPAKLHAIAGVLQDVEPLPGVDRLVQAEPPPASARS
jgi:transcriptional regulator with XRE-family HTH domain